MSLQKIEHGKIEELLEKQGGEGSTDNNIMRLISDEVYTQISDKFPKLVPYIVGVNMVEKIDDKHALGAAKLVLPIGTASIPVVYSEGKVDATTFLYNEENDMMLALTKKSVNVLIEETGELIGTSTGGDEINADEGDINSLFIPPKTYNPKIASHGMLFQVLEQDSLMKTAFAKKMQDPETAKAYSDVYGDGVAEYIAYGEDLGKHATFKDQEHETLHTMNDVLSSGWIHKEAAALEFAKNGFVISHGTEEPSMTLLKESTVATDLTARTGMTSFQTVMQQESGVFEVYKTSDLSPVKILVTRDLMSSGASVVIGKIRSIHASAEHQPIGRKLPLSECTMFEAFTEKSENGYIALFKDGTLYGVHKIGKDAVESSEKGDEKTVFILDKWSSTGINNIIVECNSSRSPVVSKKSIYVGDENIKFIPSPTGKTEDVVTLYDISNSAQLDNGKLIKVAHDGYSFIYEGMALSKVAFVENLIGSGFDKNSIYDIVKTAEEKGSAELVAISAKIDMLSNMVMNLAGAVQSSAVQPQAPAPQAPEMTPAAQESAPVAMAPQQGGLALPDDSGMPMGDQQADPEMLAQDQALLGQTPQEEQEIPDGMNPNIDPDVLKLLSQVKDSSVMDVGVIADMADSGNISNVISENKDKIAEGTSSMGKILFNMIAGKTDLIESIGEKKFNKVVSNMRSMFVKTTDLYVDIVKMDTNAEPMGN